MHIILGGTGHIGAALAGELLARGEAVTIVGRTASNADDLQRRGARFASADVNDTGALRRIVEQGRRVFVLNPPADPSTDTDVEERRSAAAIVRALDGLRFDKVVAASTYGAQPGDHIGDLGVLYEMEQALAALGVPLTIFRSAYYLSNWDAQLASARDEGVIQTFFPPGFELPMANPADIGRIAARFMTEPAESTGLHCIEGPERYSSDDVASAFASALHQPVRAVEIPRERWQETMQDLGFSEPAAASFANMTAATVEGQFPDPATVIRGTTSLRQYVATLVEGPSDR